MGMDLGHLSIGSFECKPLWWLGHDGTVFVSSPPKWGQRCKLCMR